MDRKIILDADVVIQFFKGGDILAITRIFPRNLIMIDVVYEELTRLQRHKKEIDKLIENSTIELISFPEDLKIVREYSYLHDTIGIGRGESACLAYAKHTGCVVASSNMIDVELYCQNHKIDLLTTLDILVYGVKKNRITISEANGIITLARAANCRIPVKCYEDYISKLEKGHRSEISHLFPATN